MLILDHDRARIAAFDAQILGLEHSLSKLRAARDAVQARLDAFKYAVLTLPNEVVGEILTQFMPTYPLRPPLVGPESPTLLTQVCHLWREIAVGLPALWRAIDLSDDFPSMSHQAYICGIWLKRSLSTPLSMTIGNGDTLLDLSGVLPMVIAHRERWEYIQINLLPSELMAAKGPMPLLRHLDLTVEESMNGPNTIALLDLPLLRSVTLDDVTTWRIKLPWAQLTSLTLTGVYPDECVPLLAQTCNLVHCQLYLFHHPHSALLPRVSLPRLETLTMTEGLGPMTDYLGTFLVPALLAFEVPESFLGPDPIESLSSFISTSGCKLRDVVITGDEIKFVDSYRKAFPSIDRFRFRPYHDHDQEDDDEIHSNSEIE
ncbi:hypothetical protein C8R46DRAFT_277228 [Mycena filopes]|nr:hypothetical protein C8R46DRAFT_277228 [Mycena filopes]